MHTFFKTVCHYSNSDIHTISLENICCDSRRHQERVKVLIHTSLCLTSTWQSRTSLQKKKTTIKFNILCNLYWGILLCKYGTSLCDDGQLSINVLTMGWWRDAILLLDLSPHLCIVWWVNVHNNAWGCKLHIKTTLSLLITWKKLYTTSSRG